MSILKFHPFNFGKLIYFFLYDFFGNILFFKKMINLI